MLAVLMLACVLASCGKEKDALDNTVEQASRYTSTINLWMVTESPYLQKASEMLFAGQDPDSYPEKETAQTAEQKAFLATLGSELEAAWRQLDDVQDQLNVLTKKRFKTKVNLRYFVDEAGENGYYAKLEKAFNDIDSAKANGVSLYPEITEEETVKNEYGIPELKYPTALDFQVDVLFVGGAANYYKYADMGWITPLDEMIPNSAVQLTYHLTPTLLSAAKYNGVTYAIPNNGILGEYKYLAVKTDLMNEYYISADKLENSLYSAEMKQFLTYVAKDGVTPIYSETGKIELENIHYWSYAVDGSYYVQQPDTFSLFGGFYSATDAQGTRVDCENLLLNSQYSANMMLKLEYESNGYVTADPNAKTQAAVRIETGDYAMKADLEKDGYTVLAIESPRITDEDVFDAMFAVGSHTQDPNRALEIIAMLNTEPEIRNLLQYGIEGVNYTLETVKDAKDNVIGTYAKATADNAYEMSLAKTGNMFVAYPNALESDVANGKYGIEEWANAKKQNLEATIYPTTGLAVSNSYYEVDDAGVRVLAAVSARMQAYLDAKMQEICNETDVDRKAALTEEFKALFTTATGKFNMGYDSLAEWMLQILEAEGADVMYRPAGAAADVKVTVQDLTVALAGMSDIYIDSEPPAKGSVQSTSIIYQKWYSDYFVPKKG